MRPVRFIFALLLFAPISAVAQQKAPEVEWELTSGGSPAEMASSISSRVMNDKSRVGFAICKKVLLPTCRAPVMTMIGCAFNAESKFSVKKVAMDWYSRNKNFKCVIIGLCIFSQYHPLRPSEVCSTFSADRKACVYISL